jgi:serine/threonine-protein kinase
VNPGDLIAQKYRLERQLGAGGMGMVWAATHVVTHRSLALKFVLKKSDDPGAQKRAFREARAACAVSHPNVVAVHDVIEGDDGMPILVMDLLRGESLAGKLERERVLSPKDTLAIVRPVLAALSVAHQVGVVHRDLKPDNIFLVETGEVKILDFGVAKLRGNDGATKETNRLTETGAMVGTPHYMSPEQAFGEGDVDLRADLFSVGAVMHECLSGVPPTDGQNLGQILKALATGAIRPIRDRVPDLPPPVAAVVDALLAIERDERPASAADVLAKLDAIADAPAAPLAVTDAPRADARQTTPQPATRDATPEPPPRSRSGAKGWLIAAAAAVGIAVIGGGMFAVKRGATATADPAALSTSTTTTTPTPTPTPTPTTTPTTTATTTTTSTSTSASTASAAPVASSGKTTRAKQPRPAASGNHLLNDAPF